MKCSICLMKFGEVCPLLGAAEGGMATQLKCSKENTHISSRRRNAHPDEVLDLLDEIRPLLCATDLTTAGIG